MTGEDKMNRIFVYIGIIAGLLTQDVRCGQSNGKAYYVHNLVAAIGEKNAGKEILQRIEEYTRLQGMHFVRLDCIVGNQKLNSWYEKLGYEYVRTITDGEYQGNLREKKLQVSTT